MAGGISALNKALQKLLERTAPLGGATTAAEALENLGVGGHIAEQGYDEETRFYYKKYSNGEVEAYSRQGVTWGTGTAWKGGSCYHLTNNIPIPNFITAIRVLSMESVTRTLFSTVGVEKQDVNNHYVQFIIDDGSSAAQTSGQLSWIKVIGTWK